MYASNYIFGNVYDELLNELKRKDAHLKDGSEEESPPTDPALYSMLSPFVGANSEVERLPVEAILYNISNHTVDGLQKVADNKKGNLFYRGNPYKKITGF